jgi:long-chain fatty acid transport protein
LNGRWLVDIEEARMEKHEAQLCTIATALGVALCGVQDASRAAGFQLFDQNASGLGYAYAGQAANPEDASVTFFNSAGMTEIRDGQFVGSLQFVKPTTEFKDGGSCAPYVGANVGTSACPPPGLSLGHSLGGTGGDAGTLAALPGLYLSYEALTDRLWVGLAGNAPFGSSTEWDSDWMGRFHAIRSEIKTFNFNPTVAWKINNLVSIGGGASARYLSAELSNAVSYRAVALASGVPAIIGGTSAGSEGVATVKGHDWGYGWNLGIMLNPLPTTHVGIAYRSRIAYRVEGDVTFDNRPVALASVPQVADSSVRADIKLPETLAIAATHQATPQLQLLADATWTGWSSIQNFTVVRTSGTLAGQVLSSTPLRFRDTWRTALGVGVQLDPAWKLRVGTAYDQGAATNQYRTPRLPDSDRIWLAIGAQWKPGPAWALDFGYAYVIIKDGASSLANQDTATSAPAGSLAGTYQGHAHVLGAQGRFSF